MSNCLDEVILLGGSLLLGLPLPLTALQIIWVNFFTGSLPALSFAFEENRDVGYGKGKKKKIFNREVRVLTIWVGTLTSLLLFALYWGLLTYGVPTDTARTVLFMCFTAYTIGITFSFKSIHLPITKYPLFDNKTLNIGVLISVLLTILTIAIPFIRNTLGIVTLSPLWILFILLWCAFNICIVEIAKYLLRKK
jgi:Ca2+-transporting ATPase